MLRRAPCVRSALALVDDAGDGPPSPLHSSDVWLRAAAGLHSSALWLHMSACSRCSSSRVPQTCGTLVPQTCGSLPLALLAFLTHSLLAFLSLSNLPPISLLLCLPSPQTGRPPISRGGHAAVAVGDFLLIIGGCDGGDEGEEETERFVERDLADVRIVDTNTWTYCPVATPIGLATGAPWVSSTHFVSPSGDVYLPPRSGHTAHLLPCEGGVAVMVLGGRDYRPPAQAWQEGEHHGRGDAFLLMLAGADGGGGGE